MSRASLGRASATLLAVLLLGCQQLTLLDEDAGPEAGLVDSGPLAEAARDLAPDGPSPNAPRVENLKDGETLRYPLAILRGTVPAEVSSVKVKGPKGATEWPAAGGLFKAMVLLAEGTNIITLEANGAGRNLKLDYSPQSSAHFVRFLYAIAADGDGSFDAPAGEPHDTASALARIRLAALMTQSFTAEKMAEREQGRRTFRLETTATGEPVVEVFRSKMTTAQAHGMSDMAIYMQLYGELASLPGRDVSKDVVIVGMTHWDPQRRKILARAALGGGRLAIFGSCTLHSWAPSLAEVPAHFTDDRQVDTTQTCDDSGYRGSYWANYATGLGAMMHEYGHTMTLPHAPPGAGSIMSRDFDYVNRTFVVVEPPAKLNTADRETGWSKSNSVRLGLLRWMALDAATYNDETAPSIVAGSSSVTVQDAGGLRHIMYIVDGVEVGDDSFVGVTPAPTSLTMTYASLHARFSAAKPGAILEMNALDDQGSSGTLNPVPW